jgi:hypothetical protein
MTSVEIPSKLVVPVTNATPVIDKCSRIADFNGDCRVNIVDFSIVAFWYKRNLTDSFKVREKEHLNGDGVVSLVDFSIMAFHWTG